MVTRLKEVDAVMVGMGWTGAIVARELAKAGLQVVGLERGQDRTPGEDFILPGVRDEMKYSQRLELMTDNHRHHHLQQRGDEFALPIRRWRRSFRARASAAPASIGEACTGESAHRLPHPPRWPSAMARRQSRTT